MAKQTLIAAPFDARLCGGCDTWIYTANGPFAEDNDPTKTLADFMHWEREHATPEELSGSAIGFPFMPYNEEAVSAVWENAPEPELSPAEKYAARVDRVANANADLLDIFWDRDEFSSSMIEETGGGCNALRLGIASSEEDENGDALRYIMVTDSQWGAALCNDPSERSGWMVGYYGPENEFSAETPDSDILVAEGDYCTTPVAALSLALRLMNGPVTQTHAELVRRTKAEVLRDIEDGTVDEDVADFSSLHDFVDANCYGGFTEDNRYATLEAMNAVQNDVDAWLVAGRP